MKELIEVIAKSLVDHPSEVVVTETVSGDDLLLELKVDPSDMGKEKKELHVTGVRFFKQLAIVKFKGIDNINDIERYKGCSLYVTREDAIPLEEDEYYIADLQGMQMYTEDGELFGTLRDVMETGANDVYIVDSKEHGEVLIPAIHDCILDVDLDEQKMTIHLLPGLID